jgi:8-hydroxy-5-deazaflavin:NADPH oxidoreductase
MNKRKMVNMKIAVLGTGSVGQAIAGKLLSLGHDVMIGTRNVQDARSRTAKDFYGNPGFGDWLKGYSGVKLGTIAEAVAFGEMIVNATHGGKSIEVFKMAREGDLNGKVILDLANPLDFSKGMPPILIPELCNTNSLGEELQKTFPRAQVVKTLNTMWNGLMINPDLISGGDHTNFLCGNHAEAKNKVIELLKQFGWKNENLIDLGDITASRGVELLMPVWLRIMNAKHSGAFNFKIVS